MSLDLYKKVFSRQLFFLTIPFLFWVFLFRDFLTAQIVTNVDTCAHYSVVKYYINNLLNGVMPLWEPFIFLGRPFAALVNAGFFNPLIYLIVLLKLIGVDYYHAFLVYIAVYYFIGLLGFYLLAKRLFQQELYAFLAYILLLYSGMAGMVFNQWYGMLVFLPCGWFFYFLIRFVTSFKRSDFVSLTFVSMLILGGYYPFYFVTLLLVFLLFFSVLYYKDFLKIVDGVMTFSKKYRPLILFCLLSVLIALIPLILYASRDQTGEIVSPTRHYSACHLDEAACLQGSKMTFDEVSVGGTLSERVGLFQLFAHLDKVNYFSDDFYYLPVFAYLLIFTSFFIVFNRQKFLLMSIGFILFLIAVGIVSPVHKFLYDYIFYFSYFRNFFFFISFLMPIIVLFAVSQFQSMNEYVVRSKKEKMMLLIGICLAHLCAFLIIEGQKDILISTYFTLIGSLIFFLGFFMTGFGRAKFLLWFILFVLVVVEPSEVFYHYWLNAREVQCALPKDHVYPKFSFSRPLHQEKKACSVFQARDFDFEYNMALQDSDGYIIDDPDYLSSWVYLMYLKIGNDTMQKYVRHKFILYDNVDVWERFPPEDRPKIFKDVVENSRNIAFISGNHILPSDISQSDWSTDKSIPQVISSASDKFQIMHFDMNSIQVLVDLPVKKFLVYNDAYTSHWKVFINAKPGKLYQSNIAFKGVWLPPGKNIVSFQYAPPGGSWVYGLVAIFVLCFFVGTVILLCKEKFEVNSQAFT